MGGKEELEKIKRFLGAYQHMIADRDFMLSRRPDGFWCSNPAHEVNTNYRYWNGYSFDCQCAYIPTGEIACDPSANQGSCVDTGPFTTKTIDFGIQDLWFNHSKAKKWYAIEYICEASDEWCHENHTHTLLDTLNNYIHGDPNPWEKETEISKPGEVFDLDWVTNFLQYYICSHDTTLKYGGEDSVGEGLWSKFHTRLRNVRHDQPDDMETYLEDRIGRSTNISQCDNENQSDDNPLCDAVYESETERRYTKVGGLKEDMEKENVRKEYEKK